MKNIGAVAAWWGEGDMDFQFESATAVLGTTPVVLRAWLGDLRPEWIEARESEETWSPFDIVGHLIHGERTDWIPRARVILSESADQPFEPFDRFAMFDASRGKTIQDLLGTFEALRKDSLRRLEAMKLRPEDLERTGVHPDLGRVNLRQLLATWVAHDLSHLGQIARVMAREYKEEVGPWKAYLPILGPS